MSTETERFEETNSIVLAALLRRMLEGETTRPMGMDPLRNELRMVREALDLSQMDVAKRMAVEQRVKAETLRNELGKVEKGYTTHSEERQLLLAEVLLRHAAYLLSIKRLDMAAEADEVSL